MLGMVSYSRRPKSGQIMCYLNRTYHVLLTLGSAPLVLSWPINYPLALKDDNFGSFLLLVLRRIAFLAHGLAAHFDAVGVVNQTVQDAIGDGGIAGLRVPARAR